MTSIAVDVSAETGLELVALDRPQMEAAHAQMIEWVQQQITAVKTEREQEAASLAIAKERKWATASHERHVKLADRRLTFYDKVEQALRAGYVIVPNFAMTVFAIRTDASKPRHTERDGRWNRFSEEPKLLPAGEGEYQNPAPTVVEEERTSFNEKGEKVTKWFQWPDEFRDIAFPAALAKPALMSKTAEVMAARLFDEIGVAVDAMNSGRGSRRGDPIILGRLRNPAPRRSDLTFFLGWYFDPSRV